MPWGLRVPIWKINFCSRVLRLSVLPWCRERPQTTTCCLEWLGSLVPWRLQKNNPGGLADEDESDAKIFPVPVSDRCRVKNAQDLPGPSQSNVRCSVSETKRWSKQKVQSRRRQNLVSAPLGTTTLDNMMKDMSKRAGIELHHTNHCLRATSVTVLSDHNCETRRIKSITGHKSDQAVESYNERPSLEQQQKMPLVLRDFIGNASSGGATSVQGRKQANSSSSADFWQLLLQKVWSRIAEICRIASLFTFTKRLNICQYERKSNLSFPILFFFAVRKSIVLPNLGWHKIYDWAIHRRLFYSLKKNALCKHWPRPSFRMHR